MNRLKRRRGMTWYEYTWDFERELDKSDGWIIVDILDYMEYA
jgi:hypothetical protein